MDIQVARLPRRYDQLATIYDPNVADIIDVHPFLDAVRDRASSRGTRNVDRLILVRNKRYGVTVVASWRIRPGENAGPGLFCELMEVPYMDRYLVTDIMSALIPVARQVRQFAKRLENEEYTRACQVDEEASLRRDLARRLEAKRQLIEAMTMRSGETPLSVRKKNPNFKEIIRATQDQIQIVNPAMPWHK